MHTNIPSNRETFQALFMAMYQLSKQYFLGTPKYTLAYARLYLLMPRKNCRQHTLLCQNNSMPSFPLCQKIPSNIQGTGIKIPGNICCIRYEYSRHVPGICQAICRESAKTFQAISGPGHPKFQAQWTGLQTKYHAIGQGKMLPKQSTSTQISAGIKSIASLPSRPRVLHPLQRG